MKVRGADGNPVTPRLFGAVLERGGRFKFDSFSSAL